MKPTVLAAAVFAVFTSTPAAAAPAPGPLQAVGVDEHPGARIPLDLPFTDSSGQPVTLGDWFHGDTPVLLILAYADCRALCSHVLRGVSLGLRDVDATPGDDFAVITVSIDPDESPTRAAEHQAEVLDALGRPGQRRRWPFLTGSESSIAHLADSVGFRFAPDPRTGQLAHPAVVFALTGDGRISRYLYGIRFGAADLSTALASARAGEIDERSEDIGNSVLRCFHFDPAARRYGPAIQLFFRIGAALILLALVLLVGGLYRWEKRKNRT